METHYQALCAIANFPDMTKCREFLESNAVKMDWECEPPYRIMARTASVALWPTAPVVESVSE